jgi:uncharacterized short protein YbdD (DUF466 family)
VSAEPGAAVRPIGPGSVRRWARAVHWYLRELVGETEYDRYLERHAAVHPGQCVLSRREFERSRWEQKARTPGNRCC